jgi:carbon-monoxide dehydrogenase medium subunit
MSRLNPSLGHWTSAAVIERSSCRDEAPRHRDGEAGPMKPPAFAYRRVEHADEAVEWLAELGDGAKLIAGGQSLVPMMNFRLVRPSALVDIERIAELDFVSRYDGELRIGALTTHETLERLPDASVRGGFETVRSAARLVGHPPIRSRGTFGGSVAHADPAAEWCLLAVLLDGEMVLRGPRGDRVVAASEFFQGFFATAIEPTEILTEVRLKNVGPYGALHEFARRHGDFATVAAAVACDAHDGVVGSVRVALGGVESVPVRAREAERVLANRTLDDAAIAEAVRCAVRELAPLTDVHATGEHRRELAATLVRRALEEVSEQWRRTSSSSASS